MDKQSILMGNREQLVKIREELTDQNSLKENIQSLTMENLSLQKDIEAEEKLVQDTVSTTVKKRREELEAGYNKELSYASSKLKAAKDKKESARKKAVEERISQETAEIKKENKSLHKEIKAAFKEKKVPGFCDSTFFYSLYCTSGIKEFIIFAITTVILIALIPNAVCYFFTGFWVWRILIYIGIVAVFVALYIIVYKFTKAKDKEVFEQMRPHRIKILENLRQIKKIRKRIKKDENESEYGLTAFDTEISSLEEAQTGLQKDKEKAMEGFEELTAKALEDEIKNRSKEKISEMKEQLKNTSNLVKELEEKQKELSLRIASDYEAYLGKEFMTIERIEELIRIIEEEKASTIAEAVEVTKNQA